MLKRTLNELPALAAAILSALWLFGIVDPTVAGGVYDIVGGLTGLTLTILFHENNDGPVTLWEQHRNSDS